jgi:RNA polymerase sigma-70 factor (ECF subfamily)
VALVNGAVAIIVAPEGHLRIVLAFTVDGERVTRVDVIADPGRLRSLEVAVLDE